MTRQACLGREGLSDLTLGPYATPSCHPVGCGAVWAHQLEAGGKRPETWSLGPRLGWEREEPWAHLELGSVSGSGQERKYTERVAPGLAIWAEMLAAYGKEGPGRGPGEWIPASPSPGLEPRGGARHLWAEGIRHLGRVVQIPERERGPRHPC